MLSQGYNWIDYSVPDWQLSVKEVGRVSAVDVKDWASTMSVWCNACGRLSQDHEFCDHCNVDLGATASVALPPERCPLSSPGVPLTLEQRQALAFAESSAQVQVEGQSWRVHWISPAEWETNRRMIEKRLALQVRCLPTGRLLEDGSGRWLVYKMTEYSAMPWAVTASSDSFEELQRLNAYVEALAQALEMLHHNELLWLRFDPNALEETGGRAPPDEPGDDGRGLRITNLDVELFPFRAMPERVRVHPQYAAPEIVQFRVDEIGPRTDVFHLALFTYYWLAELLPNGIAGDGLEHFDFEMPFLRIYAPRLPIGIVPVVQRGISVSPRARQETPRQFADALAESLDRAQKRRASATP